MDLDGVMDEALRNGPGAVAIACADVRAGFVLGASAFGDAEREAASDAATRVAQLAARPAPAPAVGAQADTAGALVSSSWIHAYARVSRRPELVVVGVARGEASAELLLDWVKRVAGGLEAVR